MYGMCCQLYDLFTFKAHDIHPNSREILPKKALCSQAQNLLLVLQQRNQYVTKLGKILNYETFNNNDYFIIIMYLLFAPKKVWVS